MRFVVAPLTLVTLLLSASIVPAQAQIESREGIALQNQIYQLRQELKAAEDQMGRGGGSNIRPPSYAPQQLSGGNDLVAQLLTRVDALEDQVRQLRGRIDETQNQLQQQNADLGKRIDDLAFQMSPEGKAVAGRPGASPPPREQSAAPGVLVAPTSARPSAPRPPEMMMQEGNAALARRDYPAAEAAARAVLANRTSPRAYDARLLLAQALHGEKQYAQAAIAYDDSYNSAHKGSHAQDALLGLASSLTAINEKKAACDTLIRLRTEFPKLRSDVASGATETARKAGCS
jgi:TolA-binding protein